MKKVFTTIHTEGLPFRMKRRILVSISLLFITGIILGLIFTLKPASSLIHKSLNKGIISGHEIKGEEFVLYSALWEFMKTRDPNANRIPECIRGKELEFASRLPQKDELTRSQNWVSSGPNNFSGRILSLAFDIGDENVILAAAASGGIWRTADDGNTWTKTTSPSDIPSATSIMQDMRPGKRNIWYYGTGELLSTTDRRLSIIARTVGLGDGIFKSQDGGNSWAQLPFTKTNSPGILSQVFQGIWNLAIDTSNHVQDEIYAACYGGIMRSADGGDHWSLVLGDLTFKPFSTDIAIDPKGILYAGLSTYCPEYPGNPCPIGGIWTSSDGIQWQNITPADFPEEYRRIKLAIAPSNPDIVYVSTETPIQDTDPTFGFSASQHTFWKYTHNKKNSKGSWENRTVNLPGKGRGNILSAFLDTIHGAFNSIGGYAFTLMVYPDNENTVFIGGTNLYRNTTGFADSNFTHCLGGYPYDLADTNLHPDQHFLVTSRLHHNTLFSACDGGIYKTSDCLAGRVLWNFFSQGIVNSQVYCAGMDHAASHDEFAVAGIQDNAIYITDKNIFPLSDWNAVCGGDGLTSIAADHKTFLMGSVYDGNIFSFQIDSLYNINNFYSQRPTFFCDSNFLFYTNYALDPNDNTTFYFPQKNHLWRKSNMAAAASDTNLLNTGWTELTNIGLGYQDFIVAINVSKVPANRVYFGTYTGKLFRLDQANTGNPLALNITGSGFPTNGFISCIEVDPGNADNCFVVFSNYNVQSIFRTTDGGLNWETAGGNLEENTDGSGNGPSVRWLKLLFYQGTTIYYAGTSVGLFSTTSLNGAQTIWQQESPGLIGRSIVDMIDARSTDGWVMIATQGNGIFTSYFEPTGIGDHPTINQALLEQNYPNPATTETSIKFTVHKPEQVKIILYDQEGKQVRVLLDQFVQKGSHVISFQMDHLSSGIYYYTLTSYAGRLSRKMIVLK
ncbi:MAG: T9SS type A sorting domain-containing protein [Bacteroidetes bacterium]|nr:T9SS type A sorting domain-containing protein [Bacteroidota bacterium]